MFGLKRDIRTDFLIGVELQQVSFGAFQLILSFSNEVTLSVESKFKLQRENSPPMMWVPGDFSIFPELGHLFGVAVDQYEIPGDGRLILKFKNGNIVSVYDSNKNYESFQLTGAGRTIIV